MGLLDPNIDVGPSYAVDPGILAALQGGDQAMPGTMDDGSSGLAPLIAPPATQTPPPSDPVATMMTTPDDALRMAAKAHPWTTALRLMGATLEDMGAGAGGRQGDAVNSARQDIYNQAMIPAQAGMMQSIMGGSPAASGPAPTSGASAPLSPAAQLLTQQAAQRRALAFMALRSGHPDQAYAIIKPDIQVDRTSNRLYDSTTGQDMGQLGVSMAVGPDGVSYDPHDPNNLGVAMPEAPVKGATPLFGPKGVQGGVQGWTLPDGSTQAVQAVAQSQSQGTAQGAANVSDPRTLVTIPDPDNPAATKVVTQGWLAANSGGVGGAASGAPVNLSRSLPDTAQSYANQILGRPTVASLSSDDQHTLLGIGYSESHLNPGVQNNGQHVGPFQMAPATFAALGGTNINDPGQQADAAAKYMVQNKTALSSALGRPPTPSELYLAQMQGAKGAQALISAPTGETAVNALIKAGVNPKIALLSITGNGGKANMSAGDFVSKWDGQFQRNMAAVSGGNGSATRSVSGQTVPPPPAPPSGGVLGGTAGAADTAFATGQGTDLSTRIGKLTDAREPAIVARTNALQAQGFALSHPMNPGTPLAAGAANWLRTIPPEVIKAAGFDPTKIDNMATDTATFQRIANQSLLQLGKTELPSRYTERELALGRPIIGTLSTPNETMEVTTGYTASMAQRSRNLADFASSYNGPKTRQAFEAAWANSPQGQRSVFQDPEAWSHVTIHGKPAVIYTPDGTRGVFALGTPQEYQFKVR